MSAAALANEHVVDMAHNKRQLQEVQNQLQEANTLIESQREELGSREALLKAQLEELEAARRKQSKMQLEAENTVLRRAHGELLARAANVQSPSWPMPPAGYLTPPGRDPEWHTVYTKLAADTRTSSTLDGGVDSSTSLASALPAQMELEQKVSAAGLAAAAAVAAAGGGPQACAAAQSAAIVAAVENARLAHSPEGEQPKPAAAQVDPMEEQAAPEILTPKEKLKWRKQERQRVQDLKSAQGFKAAAEEQRVVAEAIQKSRARDFYATTGISPLQQPPTPATPTKNS